MKTMNEWSSKKKQPEILRIWAYDIIDICAGQLSDDGAIQEGYLYNKILKIKEQIQ